MKKSFAEVEIWDGIFYLVVRKGSWSIPDIDEVFRCIEQDSSMKPAIVDVTLLASIDEATFTFLNLKLCERFVAVAIVAETILGKILATAIECKYTPVRVFNDHIEAEKWIYSLIN